MKFAHILCFIFCVYPLVLISFFKRKFMIAIYGKMTKLAQIRSIRETGTKNILQAFPTLYLQTCQIRRSLMHINLHYEKRLQSVRICLFCTLHCHVLSVIYQKKISICYFFFNSPFLMGLKFNINI